MDKSIVPPCSSTAKNVKAKDEDAIVENVGKQMEDLKLDHQFKKKNVPKVFQNLIGEELYHFKENLEIYFDISNQLCTMQFGHLIVRMEKTRNGWSIVYQNKKETIRTDDPEKSIVDHLWFVLRNPNTKLLSLSMELSQDPEFDIYKTEFRNSRNLDSEMLNTLLQSMFHSINHQFSVFKLRWIGFKEDTFLSVLKHVEPGTLESIIFNIPWEVLKHLKPGTLEGVDFGIVKNKEGNHQKMEEIVETEQWKQAKRIFSSRAALSKIDDFLQYKRLLFKRGDIFPKDVLLATEIKQLEQKLLVPINQNAVLSSFVYEFSNLNKAEVAKNKNEDALAENLEKKMKELKLNHQFKRENVPQVFQDLIDIQLDLSRENLEIYFNVSNQLCTMRIGYLIVRIEKVENEWIIHQNKKETIKCDDPEKSIVDHLWFALRNPNTKLFSLRMEINRDSKTKNRKSRNLDSEKLNTLLQWMFHSINHQFSVGTLHWIGFKEDTFLSVLKHVKPGTLHFIQFNISWEEHGKFNISWDYQKMEEIVEMDQWKQAKTILSPGVTPLKIQDLFQYDRFSVERDHISPEDVVLVTEHVFSSASNKSCILNARDKNIDIDAIINVLRSQNDGSDITKTDPMNSLFKYRYLIFKSGKLVFLNGCESLIIIGNFEEAALRDLKK